VIDLAEELRAALVCPSTRAALLEIVRAAVREEMRTAQPAPLDTLLDVPAAAKLLSMTPAAIRKAAERGTVPCLRLGRKLLFRRDELFAATRR
jgi:helix-turn-helix protein